MVTKVTGRSNIFLSIVRLSNVRQYIYVLCTVGDFISALFYSTKKLKLTVQNGRLPQNYISCSKWALTSNTYDYYGPNKNVHSRRWPQRATVPIKYCICYRLWVINAFGFHQQLKLVWPQLLFHRKGIRRVFDYSMRMLLYSSLYKNSQGL